MKSRTTDSPSRTVASLQRILEKLLRDKSLRPVLYISLLQLQKEVRAAASFWRNKKRSLQELSRLSDQKKLQIGGGKRYLKGFINLDLFEPADIVWDCRYGLPFEDECFEFVFSEHFLEHLDFPISVKTVLKEIYRVMRSGGSVMIGVPDGGGMVRAYYEKDTGYLRQIEKRYKKRNPPVEIYGDLDLVNYVFRDQLDNPQYTLHHWAYDKVNLTNLLRTTGFRVVRETRFDPQYCNPKRRFSTLYIKATK